MAHARLGPSSAYRWLRCPASITLSENLPPRPSGPAAAAGNLMHSVFERRLLSKGDVLADELELLAEWGIGEKRARQIIDDAIAAVNKLMRRYQLDEILTEIRVNPGAVIGRSDYWGTADLVCANAQSKTLLVADLKTGRGRVEVQFNDQLLSYALGALDLVTFRPSRVVLAILQPPLQGTTPLIWETDVETVTEFAEFARERAALTDAIAPVPNPSPEACEWCPAKAACPIHLQP